ncbi:MAG: hypothetical protein U1E62_19025 [Alsobacter sp.]
MPQLRRLNAIVGTSPFGVLRPLAWLLLTAAAIAAIEFLVAVAGPSVDARPNNFLDYRFRHEPDATRILTDFKLRLFGESRPDILQVGDSSGFHGVQPPIVAEMLGLRRYINLNVFAFGYPGYLEMARHVLERNAGIKVLVLYVTAMATPGPGFDDEGTHYGADIWREFNSVAHSWSHIPSLAYRKDILRELYGGIGAPTDALNTDILPRYPDAMALIPQSDGWEREHDVPGDVSRGPLAEFRPNFPPGISDRELADAIAVRFARAYSSFDVRSMRWANRTILEFDRFRRLAEQFGSKLVISLAPQAQSFSQGSVGNRIRAFNALMDEYRQAHPDVGVIPFQFWPDERFSSIAHVATPYTVMNTVRFAQALGQAIGPIAPTAASGPPPRRATVSHIAMDRRAPVYGFSGVESRGGAPYRTIRPGRDEGLVYANVDPATRTLVLELDGPLPPALRDGLAISVYGEPAARLDEGATGDGSRLTFGLPPAAMRYGGWLEILISTRGKTTWPGDETSPDARGPELRMTGIGFGGGR